MKNLLLAAGFVVVLSLSPTESLAQFNANDTRGDYGLQSGTQPDPGFYLIAPMYVRYDADTLRDSEGEAVLPDARDSLGVNAYVLGFVYVSEARILGGHYSFQVFPAWSDSNLEAPIFGVAEKAGTSFTDLYFQPVNLGWHAERADFIAGLGVFAPTGRYEFGADGNVGLGMWSFQVFGGTTLFFDEAKTWHFAATAFYETHSKKKDTDIRVGDFLTLEGGLGWSFLEGAASVGLTYFAQWKLTDDDFGSFDIDGQLEAVGLPPLAQLPVGRNRVYGLGPELSLPIATSEKLIAILNARYLFELGARTSLEGSTFQISATFPIPSVSRR